MASYTIFFVKWLDKLLLAFVSGKSVESKNVGGFFVLNQAEVSHIVMALIWIEIADAIELHWPTKNFFSWCQRCFNCFYLSLGRWLQNIKKKTSKNEASVFKNTLASQQKSRRRRTSHFPTFCSKFFFSLGVDFLVLPEKQYEFCATGLLCVSICVLNNISVKIWSPQLKNGQ